MISILIPCYNEKDSILKILNKIQKIKISKEIIIIDGGSNDGTIDLLKKIHDKEIKIFYEKTKGKGAAISIGLSKVKNDIVIIQDADLEYDPEDYYELIKPIYNKEYQVVYGSRFLNKNNKKGYISNYVANRFLTSLCNLKTGYKITDMETCYKVFSKEIIPLLKITEQKFGIEVQITSILARNNIKIKEIPINYYPRTKKEGKKINIHDGIEAIKCIFKYNK